MAMYASPRCHRRLRHLPDRVPPVRRLRMHVQVAADVRQRNQLRQSTRLCLAKLAAAASISPQFSRSSGGM